MNINNYKVLDELKYPDDTIYVIRREPAYYYSEFNVDVETRIGLVFNKEKEVLGISWSNESKLGKRSLSKMVNDIMENEIDFDSYTFHKAKCDLVLLYWYEFLSDYFHLVNEGDGYNFIIESVTSTRITFSNGKQMRYDHLQDCCEHNYAQFTEISEVELDYVLQEPLTFETVKGYGFRFGNEGRMISVPCYSVQNGYYDDTVDIYYNDTCMLESMTKIELD